MSPDDLQAERRVTGWILAGLAASLSAAAVWWLVDGRLGDHLGLTRPVDRPLVAWTLTFVIVAGYCVHTLRIPLVRRLALEPSGLKLVGIWAAVVSGVVEEVVFRRILMDWLLTLGAPATLQVLGSALAFGVAHAAWVLMGGQIRAVIPVVGATTVLGAALAVLYLVAGRNVLPSAAAHVAINLVIEPGLVLAAVTGRWRR